MMRPTAAAAARGARASASTIFLESAATVVHNTADERPTTISPTRYNMCWLCTYQGEPLGARLGAFIVRHIGIMDMACIAQQVSDLLLTQDPKAEGADSATVLEHVARHMLHPRVRMAVLLRQLLDFSSILQNSMVVNDNGVCTVEKGNAELYLKVISQITTLYRVDVSGMLFADDDTAAEAAGGEPGSKKRAAPAAPSSS